VTWKQIVRREHASKGSRVFVSDDLFPRQAACGGRQLGFMSFMSSL